MGIIADTLRRSMERMIESDNRSQELTSETIKRSRQIIQSIETIDQIQTDYDQQLRNLLDHLRDKISSGHTHSALIAFRSLDRFLTD